MAGHRFTYRLTLEEDDNGTVLATSPDIEGFVTYGDDAADAAAKAIDAIKALLSHLMEEGRDIPAPGRARKGEPTVTLPTLLAGKLAVYSAMRAAKVSQRELARRLGIDERQVRRLLDPLNATRFDEIDAALHALGQRPELVVRKGYAAAHGVGFDSADIGKPVQRHYVVPLGETIAGKDSMPPGHRRQREMSGEFVAARKSGGHRSREAPRARFKR